MINLIQRGWPVLILVFIGVVLSANCPAQPPPATEAELTVQNGAADDQFGQSVSLNGNTVLVGARNDSVGGAAYSFARDSAGSNAWSFGGMLWAADAASGDDFGTSVSLGGHRSLVGAPVDYPGGAAYVFQRKAVDSNKWEEAAKLTASDGELGDQFGYSVSLDGDVALVGAYRDTAGALYSGSAYIFEWDSGSNLWGQVAKLTPSDPGIADLFGFSVSLDGDRVLIGALNDDVGGSQSGSAYIFERHWGGSNAWGQAAKLAALDAATSNRFGVSVSLCGNTALVGAYEANGATVDSGSAYIFDLGTEGSNDWDQVAELKATNGAAGDRFGSAVALADNLALIGARYDDDRGTDSGSASIFRRHAGGSNKWGQVAFMTASDGAMDDDFGFSVSLSGATALVGARNGDGAVADSGSAYVFEGMIANREPIATDDAMSVPQGMPTDIHVLANDTDPDGHALAISGTTQGTNGTVSISEGLDYVIYTPTGNWLGLDTFDYWITDNYGGSDTAAVSVTIYECDVHYVALSGQAPDDPYTNWLTAATNIQDAVDAASDGDTVLVSNGVYATRAFVTPGGSLSNRVVITNRIAVRAVSGPTNTFIVGASHNGTNGPSAVRCVYMSAGTLEGFTLTDGHTRISGDLLLDQFGGGAFASNAVLTNCTISGNSAQYGGGTYRGTLRDCRLVGNSARYGGGTYDGTLEGCMVAGNGADEKGGGAYAFRAGNVHHSTIISNTALDGGGVYLSVVNDSTVIGNVAHGKGGGLCEGTANRCMVRDNLALEDKGGGLYGGVALRSRIMNNAARWGGGAYDTVLANCLVASNSATSWGGGAYGGSARFCTVADNTASNIGGGTVDGYVECSIVYNNSATDAGDNYYGGDYEYSCTTPFTNGPGNTASSPMFVDRAAGDYYLLPGSPCVDTATIITGITNDLAGAARPLDGDFDGAPEFDMGAYECTFLLPDLVVAKSASETRPAQTDAITYTVTLVNSGTAPASGVAANDQLPAGVSYVGDNGGGAYDPDTGWWTVRDLPVGAVTSLVISATVDLGTIGLAITNWATASTTNLEVDTHDNTNSAVIQVADPGVFRFASDVYSVGEADGTATITVIRERGSDGIATVEFVCSNGTARTEDSDYAPTNGTLTFTDSQTARSFGVQVLDDDVLEGEEYVQLALQNPGNYAELGSPSEVGLVILDDEAETTVDDEDFGSGGASPDSRRFSSGNQLQAAPSGWTVVSSGDPGAAWSFEDPGDRTNRTGGSGGFAIADSAHFGAVEMDTELRSPAMDLTNMFSVSLEFMTDFKFKDVEIADVDVSSNAAAGPWANVWSRTGAGIPGPHTETIDITTPAAGQSNVMIRFRYHGATNAWWWQVDNVRVYGEVDDDGDGLPDWWEEVRLLDPDAPEGHNTDGDPFTDAQEYWVDTDPKDSNDYLYARDIWPVNSVSIEFMSSPLVHYGIDWKSNLMQETWSNLTDDVQGVGGIQTIVDPTDHPARFYRLYGGRD